MAITSITTKKLNPWLEHVKAYKLEHPEVNLKSVLTEARKTYKTVKTVKQDSATESKKKKATESKTTEKKARRQVVKKNVDNPDEQQLLKVLQKRLELDQLQTPAVTKKTTASKKTTNSNKKKRVQRSKKNIEDYTDTRSVTVGDEQDSNELIE